MKQLRHTHWFAALLSLGLPACAVDIPEGRFACTPATVEADCPADWYCRGDGLCYRTADGTDAGIDAGTDAGTSGFQQPAGTVAAGLLTLTQQEDGLISATGIATWARLVNGNDVTALDLDCTGTDGTGDVKLASTNLYLGGDARLVSAILV